MPRIRTAKEHESRLLLLGVDFQWFLVALPVNRLDAVELSEKGYFQKDAVRHIEPSFPKPMQFTPKSS